MRSGVVSGEEEIVFQDYPTVLSLPFSQKKVGGNLGFTSYGFHIRCQQDFGIFGAPLSEFYKLKIPTIVKYFNSLSPSMQTSCVKAQPVRKSVSKLECI